MLRIEHGIRVSALALCLLAGANSAYGQSGTATLGGTVVDESNAVVPDVTVTVMARATGFQREKKTEGEGRFSFPALQPGKYTVRATLQGFTPVEVPDLTLNVGDNVSIRLKLTVEKVGAEVTVVAEPSRVSTSPAVGTVIDRQFVENLPLNGRSLQSLLELTPGVVLTRSNATANIDGQFSVNGQRPSSNYFLVDGVSANVGIIGGSMDVGAGSSGAGQLPGLTALGGTNGLVSVDALQEFRIQTSTYAPEFGRTPGGQISMVTRSGTNRFHGSVFDYFRDDAMDARDWFTKNLGLAKPELMQHNFGGVLGGPILPGRTFFFGSYEGLRLKRPRTRVVTVPNMEVRRTALPALKPFLDALPIPNGREVSPGYAQFAASFSEPSRFDSTSIRTDGNLATGITLFGRVSHTPSYTQSRSGSMSTLLTNHQDNTSVTIGSTWSLSARIFHDLRVNVTRQHAPVMDEPDAFGGAIPLTLSAFPAGRTPDNTLLHFVLLGGGSLPWGTGSNFEQRQLNIVDSLTLTSRNHQWKMGIDYRRINPVLRSGPTAAYQYVFDTPDLPAGRLFLYRYAEVGSNVGRHAIAFDNLSLYVQDDWKPASRATLTYGVRWEYVPPPHTTDGPNAITLENIDDPYGGQVHIAPRDTPLWRVRYNNVAPRIGGSYVLSERPGAQLVVKGGFGIFHDLGFGQVAGAFSTYPFVAEKTARNVSFPLSADVLEPPRVGESRPPSITIMHRNLKLPFTYQWNVSAERSFGARQTLTVSYVGAEGRRLLRPEGYSINLLEWPGAARTNVNVTRNRGYSDYRALQMQFQRRLHRGLQALVSYTYGHSRDTSSSDIGSVIPSELLPPELDYGYSAYDVRHVFTAAVTYQTPRFAGDSMWQQAARDWGVDVILRGRSGFPINVVGNVSFPPISQTVRPNVVEGQPFWIDDSTVPGGRRLNRQAFALPPPSTQGNLQRGSVRGFSVSQVDLALRRDVSIAAGVRMQFRFEMFNLLNRASFADPVSGLASADFGVSTQTLNQGFGGLNALYQIGGPRSSQLSLKLIFGRMRER